MASTGPGASYHADRATDVTTYVETSSVRRGRCSRLHVFRVSEAMSCFLFVKRGLTAPTAGCQAGSFW